MGFSPVAEAIFSGFAFFAVGSLTAQKLRLSSDLIRCYLST
jgi:hypothetical protein